MKTYRVTMPNCDEQIIVADGYTQEYASCIKFTRKAGVLNLFVALVQGPSFIIEDVTDNYGNE